MTVLPGLIPRYKDRDNSISTTWKRYRTINGGSKTLLATVTGLKLIDSSHMVGYDHPNFHKLRREGKLLSKTPFSQTVISGGIIRGVYDYTHIQTPNTVRYFTEGNIGIPDANLITSTTLSNAAPEWDTNLIQEAAEKIMSEAFDGLTFLSELTKTTSMFTNLAKRIVTFQVPKNMKDMSSDWLEGRYGWRTLLMDCEDLSKALTRLNQVHMRRLSKNKQRVTNSTVPVVNDYLRLGTVVDFHTEKLTTVETSLRASVTADIDIPPFSFNPFITAWELVPYSFVLDWIIGVGTAISSISFLAINERYVASLGYRVAISESYIEYDKQWYNGANGNIKTEWFMQGELILRYPQLVPRIPQYRVKLSVAKIFDLIAMLVQRKWRN